MFSKEKKKRGRRGATHKHLLYRIKHSPIELCYHCQLMRKKWTVGHGWREADGHSSGGYGSDHCR